MTAALAQWARIPKRGARVGAALALSDREGGHQRRMPVHDGAMGNLEGGESATSTGGGLQGGEEDKLRRRGRRCWWGCVRVDDDGEDDGGDRRLQATTTP